MAENLDFLSDEELVLALFSRFDNSIFAGHRHLTNKDYQFEYKAKGDPYTLRGMAVSIDIKTEENLPNENF